ncbi:YniB family protein [Thorsellia anophelis]|uniref:YniB-like protein n=1 Tax=Thorsellia anophelis DSM 18579 TaxID=1123402 RepID=A0A1H9Z7G7_9GAMM|nr:YniB family protein [Thorsellia anophelis]SES77496.1 YniB-like protein [Thorsellia anophelis DSM 18579]
MTYQLARTLAYVKLVSGWLIFTVCLLWTTCGALQSLLAYSKVTTTASGANEEGNIAFIIGIIQSVIATLETSLAKMNFIGFYWSTAPTPTIGHGFFGDGNFSFFIVFWGMFLGMALVQSSDKLFRQVRNVKQTVESLLLIESARGETVQSRDELISQLKLRHHSVFVQYFPLYIFPIIIIAIINFALGFLGM